MSETVTTHKPQSWEAQQIQERVAEIRAKGADRYAAPPPEVDLPRESVPAPTPVAALSGEEQEYMRRVAEAEPDEREAKLIVVLGEGRDAALTSKQIEKVTGLTGSEVRRGVQILRLDGFAICSATGGNRRGYWLAATGEEFAACTLQHHRRALRQLVINRAMRRTHGKLFSGQLPLLAE